MSASFMKEVYSAGVRYIENQGWSIMPMSTASKSPIQEWAQRDKNPITTEEWEAWSTRGAPSKNGSIVAPFNVAILTGKRSGIVVVDCDHEAAAMRCREMGVWSPVRVRTRRGVHLYFKRGKEKTKTKGAFFNINGIDVRGDGGYVLAPPSVSVDDNAIRYSWEIDPGHDFSDIPPLPDLEKLIVPATGEEEEDGSILLDSVVAMGKSRSLWDELTAKAQKDGKFESGKRNNTMTRIVGELVAKRVYGEHLYSMCMEFMETCFKEPLSEPEIRKCIDQIVRADRRNNPSRYTMDGSPVVKQSQPRVAGSYIIRMDEAVVTPAADRCIAHPLIHQPKIIQIHGHSGSGKSMFTYSLLHNIGAGKDWGPFSVMEKARIVYFDYDMGISQLYSRSAAAIKSYGPSSLALIHAGSTATGLMLNTDEGREEFMSIVDAEKPQIVVIDSIREAWPGLDETSSWAWAPVNAMLKELRDLKGMTVIFVHHSNKPGERTLGREAGSTAQLNTIDMQLHVIQLCGRDLNDVVLDPEQAESIERELNQTAFSKGLLRDDYCYTKLSKMATDKGLALRLPIIVQYGKNRDGVPGTGRKMIGFCESVTTGTAQIVSDEGDLQVAKRFKKEGLRAMAENSGLPISELKKHLSEEELP